MNYKPQDVRALKERRKLSKITARELYEAAGLTCTRYAAIEDGHDLPTSAEWYAIDTAFYSIDNQRAMDAGKWLLSGTTEQSEALRKLAKWNSAAQEQEDTPR